MCVCCVCAVCVLCVCCVCAVCVLCVCCVCAVCVLCVLCTRPGCQGSHTTTRELQTCTSEGPNALNTTKIPRKRPKEKEKRVKNCGGRRKKSAKFWAPTLRPHPSGPHPSGPPPFGAPTLRGPHPSGPHNFGPPQLRALTLRGLAPHLRGPTTTHTRSQNRLSKIGLAKIGFAKIGKNQNGQNGIGQSRSFPGGWEGHIPLLAQTTFGPPFSPLLARLLVQIILGPDHFWPTHPLTIHNVKMTLGKNPSRRSQNNIVRAEGPEVGVKGLGFRV